MYQLKSTLSSVALSGLLLGHPPVNARAVYQHVSPAIVSVYSKTFRRDPFSPRNLIEVSQGSGTGFFVDSQHIVTNYHVIKDADKVEVKVLGGKEVDAIVDNIDQSHDIALLHIAGVENVVDGRDGGEGEGDEGVKLCQEDPFVGQDVFAIGDPFGLERSFTAGIVSGLDRTLESSGNGGGGNGSGGGGGEQVLLHMIQVDAPINPGNSGGALVDARDGCILGMNTAIVSSGSGIGFATPAKYIEQFVANQEGEGRGKGPFVIGVKLLPDQLAAELGIKGVVVVDAVPGMPASEAGIVGTHRGKEGFPHFGDIIVGVEDVDIENAVDLYRAFDKYKNGDVVRFRVKRSGGEEEVTIKG